MWAIQLLDNFGPEGEAAAREALGALREQDGFLGGRVLAHSPAYPGWRVQAFFQDEPEAGDWLPDGMRRVFIPGGMLGVERLCCRGA